MFLSFQIPPEPDHPFAPFIPRPTVHCVAVRRSCPSKLKKEHDCWNTPCFEIASSSQTKTYSIQHLCAAQLVCCCCSRSFNAKQDIGATSTTTFFCRVALLTLLPYYHPHIRPDRTDALHASLPAISCRLRSSLSERQSSILIPAGPFTRFDGVNQTRVA